MARKQKIGLDYFPIQVNILQNKKVALIEAEFGGRGFVIWVKLLAAIYRDKGYFIHWDVDTELLLAREFGEPGSFVGEVVKRCIKRGLFDQAVFDMFQILTSAKIQDIYLEAAARREQVEIEADVCLVDINVYKNAINVRINYINVNISTQSKVENNIVKKSKEVIGDSNESHTKLLGSRIFKTETKESPPDSAAPPQKQNIVELKEKRAVIFTEKVTEINERHLVLKNDELQKFISFWSESSEGQVKLKFEKQDAFDIHKRLVRWRDISEKNNYSNKRNNNNQAPIQIGRQNYD